MSAGYEALATKVKAMYGKRLRYADYVRLARMASVSEIYADLRQHPVWMKEITARQGYVVNATARNVKLVASKTSAVISFR